jgi:predicted nucleic acid-binding protein
VIVVDTSLALQWVLDEPDSDRAEALLRGQSLAAPDVLFVEAANVLGKKIRKSQIGLKQGVAGLDFIRSRVPQIVPSATLVERGMELSVELNHPVYDCIFLACAEQFGATLATRDAPFAMRVEQSPYSSALYRDGSGAR